MKGSELLWSVGKDVISMRLALVAMQLVTDGTHLTIQASGVQIWSSDQVQLANPVPWLDTRSPMENTLQNPSCNICCTYPTVPLDQWHHCMPW